MSLNTAVMFGKASDEWETPRQFYLALDAEFQFLVDAAATVGNATEGIYYHDALDFNWFETNGVGPYYCNPPYSRCREFITKAAQEAVRGATVVCLVPSRTDTRWWHQHVWDASTNQPRSGVEIRFVKGRLKFGDSENSAPFPSVVIVFRPPCQQGALDLFPGATK